MLVAVLLVEALRDVDETWPARFFFQNWPDNGYEDEIVKGDTPEEQQEIEDMMKTNSHLQQSISALKNYFNANY